MKKDIEPVLKLIAARRKLGLTQEEVAKEAKMSRSTYSNIERGEYSPSLANAYAIAKVLKSTIEHLFFKCNARKTNNDLVSIKSGGNGYGRIFG